MTGSRSPLKLTLVVGLLLGVVGLLAGCGGTANEVHFQNASDPGPKPFTPPTDVPDTNTTSTSTDSSSRSSSGAKRGAFTKRNTQCDREKLIAELKIDPDRLKAWADAVGIDNDPNTVADFIRKLKPSTLSRDTQVTSHRYEDGGAQAYQVIMPKGTAVLVDDSGKPVARCVCGNPLSDAQDLADHTKCFDCPANYRSPPKCEGNCSTADPDPIPIVGGPRKGDPGTVDPDPGDPILKAKDILDKCKKDKGSLQACKTEYENTRKLCGANPINAACDSSVCFDGIVAGGGASSGCSSYLPDPNGNQSDIQVFCAGFGDSPGAGGLTLKQICLKNMNELQASCIADPTQANCKIDPKVKLLKSREACTINLARPECGAVIGACQKVQELRCEALQNKFNDVKQKCAANPAALPDCKSLPVIPKTLASGLPLLTQEQADKQAALAGPDTGTDTGTDQGANGAQQGGSADQGTSGTDQGGGTDQGTGGTDQGGGQTQPPDTTPDSSP